MASQEATTPPKKVDFITPKDEDKKPAPVTPETPSILDAGKDDKDTFIVIPTKAQIRQQSTENRSRGPNQSERYQLSKDLFYMKDSKGKYHTPTAHSAMHHIVHTLLRETWIFGPIRSAFDNGGYTDPYQLMMMDPSDLRTNRNIDGQYLEDNVPLPQAAVKALLNLQSFQIVQLMGQQDIQYENWMKFTNMDLIRFAIERNQNSQQEPKSPPSRSRAGKVKVEDKVENEDWDLSDDDEENSMKSYPGHNDKDHPDPTKDQGKGEQTNSTANKTLSSYSCLKNIRKDVSA